MERQRWEFARFDSAAFLTNKEEHWNHVGDDGWELVSVIKDRSSYITIGSKMTEDVRFIGYFKRPK
jgi:hypothetical protein